MESSILLVTALYVRKKEQIPLQYVDMLFIVSVSGSGWEEIKTAQYAANNKYFILKYFAILVITTISK